MPAAGDSDAAAIVEEPEDAEDAEAEAEADDEDDEDTDEVILSAMATRKDLLDSRIWLKQNIAVGTGGLGGTCTLAASAMMLRRAAILDGKKYDEWKQITENSIKSKAWKDGAGLYNSFTAYGYNVQNKRPGAMGESALKQLIDAHPEGVVIYNGTHAVLLTDYSISGGKCTFYCADPAYGDRRKLTSAEGNVRVGNVNQYWCITSKVAKPTDSGTASGMNKVAPHSNTVYDVPARWYSLRYKADPTKTVDITGQSTNNGVNVQLYTWNHVNTQQFIVRADSSVKGAYKLVCAATRGTSSEKFITVKGASTANQANIVQQADTGDNSQKWYIESNSDGTCSFRNVNSGLYLDVQGGKAVNKTNVSQWNPGNAAPPNSSRFYLVSSNAELWNVKLAADSFEYTGKAIDPGVKAYATPMAGGFQLVQGSDYSLTLRNNVNVGTGTYVVHELTSDVHDNTGTFAITAAPISKASVSKVGDATYTGKAITPKPTVTFNGTTLKQGTDYTLAYKNNTAVGTATITITGKGNFKGSTTTTFKIAKKAQGVQPIVDVMPMPVVKMPTSKASVTYRTHVQTYGWQGYVKDGKVSGTSGKSKRLEGINIKLASKPVSGSIQYRTHIQTYGWEKGWKSDGAMSGTSGKSKRLEAIQIRLTGDMAKKYDVYYRVHAQRFGWMGWTKNGAQAGTAGYSYRLEAIQIVLVPKGSAAPSKTYQGVTQTTARSFAQK